MNYHTMKENILKELDEPLEKAPRMAITIPDFFQRDQVTKKIKLTERKQHYQLVFDKRVLTPPLVLPHPTVTTGSVETSNF